MATIVRLEDGEIRGPRLSDQRVISNYGQCSQIAVEGSLMKGPPDIEFREDLHLLIWRPRGMLNETATNKLLAYISDEEARSDANELRFIDTSRLTAVALNF